MLVVGYGGWDDLFTRTLTGVTSDQSSYLDLVFFDGNVNRIEKDQRRLFERLAPAIQRGRTAFFAGECPASGDPQSVGLLVRARSYTEGLLARLRTATARIARPLLTPPGRTAGCKSRRAPAGRG